MGTGQTCIHINSGTRKQGKVQISTLQYIQYTHVHNWDLMLNTNPIQ